MRVEFLIRLAALIERAKLLGVALSVEINANGWYWEQARCMDVFVHSRLWFENHVLHIDHGDHDKHRANSARCLGVMN